MLSQKKRIEASESVTKQTQKHVLELTKMISQQNNEQILSTYFTNRGVLYYQLGNYEWAQADFQKAVALNHLNYAAYYNIFSICFTENNLLEGLKNLCCSLSCLYLIRGRQRNNQSDISKCVKLAENNHEGRLLRALQYAKKGKYSLSINQINWVLEAEPYNKQIMQVKKFLTSMIRQSGSLVGTSDQQQQEMNVSGENQLEKSTKKRLECTQYDDTSENQQLDYFIQAEKKLSQFNEVYRDLNLSNTAKHQGYFYNIFLLKSQLQDQSQENSPRKQKNQQKDSMQNTSEYEVTTSPPRITPRTSSEQFRIANSIEYQVGSVQSQAVESSISHEDAKNIQGSSSTEQPILFGSMNRNSSKTKSGISASNSNYQTNSFITVQAHDEQVMLHIKIQKIQITNMPQPQISKLQSLYCLFDYGESELLIKSDNSLTYGKETDQQEGRNLVVKLFNKQILAFNDRYLGSGEVEVAKSGHYIVPIYLDKNKTKQVGHVELFIDLI